MVPSLLIGVSMAKLWPLLSHCKYFMKCVFAKSFYIFIMLYTEDFSMCHYVGFVVNQVTS